jgi:hypothetical protein
MVYDEFRVAMAEAAKKAGGEAGSHELTSRVHFVHLDKGRARLCVGCIVEHNGAQTL